METTRKQGLVDVWTKSHRRKLTVMQCLYFDMLLLIDHYALLINGTSKDIIDNTLQVFQVTYFYVCHESVIQKAVWDIDPVLTYADIFENRFSPSFWRPIHMKTVVLVTKFF